MSRLIRRGLRVGDEDWRQSWTQFCWKKGISSRLSSRNPALGPPQEMLAAFVESHLPKLKRASWARSLLKEDRAPAASRSRDWMSAMPGRTGRSGRAAGPARTKLGITTSITGPGGPGRFRCRSGPAVFQSPGEGKRGPGVRRSMAVTSSPPKI